jgi:uncharacterized protein YndB with AHSA1/START domain
MDAHYRGDVAVNMSRKVYNDTPSTWFPIHGLYITVVMPNPIIVQMIRDRQTRTSTAGSLAKFMLQDMKKMLSNVRLMPM